MKSSKKSYFSLMQVLFGSVALSPLAGIFMTYRNYKLLGEHKKAKTTLILVLPITIALFGLLFLLPENIINNIPPILIPAAGGGFFYGLMLQYRPALAKLAEEGHKKAAWWKIILITIIVFVITVFATLSFYNYQTYKNYECKVDENSRGKKVYDQQQATCYISRLVGKKYSAQDIHKILSLEYEYQQKIGLIDSPQPQTAPPPIVDPVPYIVDSGKSKLSKQQIEEILLKEDEYLKFIGVME